MFAKKNCVVVALCGFKRSGKDAFADALCRSAGEILESEGVIFRSAFADPIRSVVDDVFGVNGQSVEDKEALIPYSKRYFGEDVSMRGMVVRVGEGMKSIVCPNVWCISMEDRLYRAYHSAEGKKLFAVMTDVRYAQELKLVGKLRRNGWNVKLGGVFRREALPDWWKVGLDPNSKTDRAIIEEDFGVDHSEYEVLQRNPKLDFAVYNDGTLEEMQSKAKALAERLAGEM